jgi:non-ribosomal peptide synthetase component F
VPHDPSHPSARHQQVVQQTGATLALTSSLHANLCDGLVENMLQITPELDWELARDVESSKKAPVTDVDPSTACYVLFTSGSTGVPKGFVIEHRALVTSQNAMWARLRMTPQVRMLQFASCVFDMSIGEAVPP